MIKRHSYLAAPDILHCQAPLGESETLHLKGGVFCDQRLKPSVRAPAWKALSLNLGHYLLVL